MYICRFITISWQY